MSFHTKKQKKKILIPNKFYVSFNLALLKKKAYVEKYNTCRLMDSH